ncbi:MAG: hypothetical protein M1832_006272 [Thelocarpon impressellum]|nr:MAG: hypothetical protein M1832_006272 [Thelocarpon impressellum]
MAKDRSINPAQAQRKLEKQKAVKKGKAEQAARRTEKLARRNPERLQRQVDELKGAEASGKQLNNRDKKVLEELERDLKAVRKARDNLGDKAPQFRSGRGGAEHTGQRGGRAGSSLLGKRRREDDGGPDVESDSSTTSSVRNIPMPRDTPPPIPPEFLRPRRDGRGNPNLEPLPEGSQRMPHALPSKPSATPTPQQQAQTIYSAAPQVRDLRKEAVSAFVPAAVRQKLEAKKGLGRLLEPEELEKLEREGYGGVGSGATASEKVVRDAAPAVGGDNIDSERLRLEEERFERELRNVTMEEVEDEDA